jgi:hypothetical protein
LASLPLRAESVFTLSAFCLEKAPLPASADRKKAGK